MICEIYFCIYLNCIKINHRLEFMCDLVFFSDQFWCSDDDDDDDTGMRKAAAVFHPSDDSHQRRAEITQLIRALILFTRDHLRGLEKSSFVFSLFVQEKKSMAAEKPSETPERWEKRRRSGGACEAGPGFQPSPQQQTHTSSSSSKAAFKTSSNSESAD